MLPHNIDSNTFAVSLPRIQNQARKPVANEGEALSAILGNLRRNTRLTPGLEAKIIGAVINRAQCAHARNYPEYGSFHKVA